MVGGKRYRIRTVHDMNLATQIDVSAAQYCGDTRVSRLCCTIDFLDFFFAVGFVTFR
jgi:hypothetical protein